MKERGRHRRCLGGLRRGRAGPADGAGDGAGGTPGRPAEAGAEGVAGEAGVAVGAWAPPMPRGTAARTCMIFSLFGHRVLHRAAGLRALPGISGSRLRPADTWPWWGRVQLHRADGVRTVAVGPPFTPAAARVNGPVAGPAVTGAPEGRPHPGRPSPGGAESVRWATESGCGGPKRAGNGARSWPNGHGRGAEARPSGAAQDVGHMPKSSIAVAKLRRVTPGGVGADDSLPHICQRVNGPRCRP